VTSNSDPQQQENTEDLRSAPAQGASRGLSDLVEDVLPSQADRDLVFWKTSNRIFRLGLTDTAPAVSALVTV
jgi:hypothetical protein